MIRRFIMSAGVALCALSASAKEGTVAKDTAVFKVEMHCGGCVNKITKELTYMSGVTDLKVTLEDKRVWVEYKPKKVSGEAIEAKLKEMGYTVEREND